MQVSSYNINPLVGLHLMESEALEDSSEYPDFNVDGRLNKCGDDNKGWIRCAALRYAPYPAFAGMTTDSACANKLHTLRDGMMVREAESELVLRSEATSQSSKVYPLVGILRYKKSPQPKPGAL